MAMLETRAFARSGVCFQRTFCLLLIVLLAEENIVVSNIDLSCPGFSHSGDSSGHTQQPHIEPQCMPQGWQSTIVYKDTTRLGLLIQPNTSLRYDKLAFRSRTTLEFGSHCRMTLTRIEFNASGLCGVELVRIERERLGSRRGATKNYTMESWTTCDGRKLQLVSGHFSNPKNDEILYTPSENRMVELSFNMIPPRHGSCPKCRISSGIDKGEVLPDLHLYAVDVNECHPGRHQCHVNGGQHCVNTIGSYCCTSPPTMDDPPATALTVMATEIPGGGTGNTQPTLIESPAPDTSPTAETTRGLKPSTTAPTIRNTKPWPLSPSATDTGTQLSPTGDDRDSQSDVVSMIQMTESNSATTTEGSAASMNMVVIIAMIAALLIMATLTACLSVCYQRHKRKEGGPYLCQWAKCLGSDRARRWEPGHQSSLEGGEQPNGLYAVIGPQVDHQSQQHPRETATALRRQSTRDTADTRARTQDETGAVSIEHNESSYTVLFQAQAPPAQGREESNDAIDGDLEVGHYSAIGEASLDQNQQYDVLSSTQRCTATQEKATEATELSAPALPSADSNTSDEASTVLYSIPEQKQQRRTTISTDLEPEPDQQEDRHLRSRVYSVPIKDTGTHKSADLARDNEEAAPCEPLPTDQSRFPHSADEHGYSSIPHLGHSHQQGKEENLNHRPSRSESPCQAAKAPPNQDRSVGIHSCIGEQMSQGAQRQEAPDAEQRGPSRTSQKQKDKATPPPQPIPYHMTRGSRSGSKHVSSTAVANQSESEYADPLDAVAPINVADDNEYADPAEQRGSFRRSSERDSQGGEGDTYAMVLPKHARKAED